MNFYSRAFLTVFRGAVASRNWRTPLCRGLLPNDFKMRRPSSKEGIGSSPPDAVQLFVNSFF
jgi:hypothetical protein